MRIDFDFFKKVNGVDIFEELDEIFYYRSTVRSLGQPHLPDLPHHLISLLLMYKDNTPTLALFASS